MERILACHGYEIHPDGRFSKLLDSVCRTIAEVHHNYDLILLLAGQHLNYKEMTVDQEMWAALVSHDVPVEKLITWSDIVPEQRPPRDTMEESDIVPPMLRYLGYQPRETEFDVACIWYFGPRIRYILRNRRAKVGRIHGAPSLDPKRMAIEAVAYLATRQSPSGELPIFQKNRAARNVFPTQPNGRPWIDNLPSAWDDPPG